MSYIIRFFGDPSSRWSLDLWTPWASLWESILKFWRCVDPIFVFSAQIWVELILNMPCIIMFNGDPSRGTLDPHGSPCASLIWNFKRSLTLYLFSEIWVKLITNMPYIIRFSRDPLWTSRGPPVGSLGVLPGVLNFYQDPKTSLGTSRDGLESFKALTW